MLQKIQRKSKAQGLAESRLPVFTPAEIAALKGSSDFFGLNFYVANYVNNSVNNDQLASSYFSDQDVFSFKDKENWIRYGDYLKSIIQ